LKAMVQDVDRKKIKHRRHIHPSPDWVTEERFS